MGGVGGGWAPEVGVAVCVELGPGLFAGFVAVEEEFVRAAGAGRDLGGEGSALFQGEVVAVGEGA